MFQQTKDKIENLLISKIDAVQEENLDKTKALTIVATKKQFPPKPKNSCCLGRSIRIASNHYKNFFLNLLLILFVGN